MIASIRSTFATNTYIGSICAMNTRIERIEQKALVKLEIILKNLSIIFKDIIIYDDCFRLFMNRFSLL